MCRVNQLSSPLMKGKTNWHCRRFGTGKPLEQQLRAEPPTRFKLESEQVASTLVFVGDRVSQPVGGGCPRSSAPASFAQLPQLMLQSPAIMRTEPVPPTEDRQPHIVSVHSLVEFVLQAGDLTPGGFKGGIALSSARKVTSGCSATAPQATRPRWRSSTGSRALIRLEVRGRIDGCMPAQSRSSLEEIKTTTLSLGVW